VRLWSQGKILRLLMNKKNRSISCVKIECLQYGSAKVSQNLQVVKYIQRQNQILAASSKELYRDLVGLTQMTTLTKPSQVTHSPGLANCSQK